MLNLMARTIHRWNVHWGQVQVSRRFHKWKMQMWQHRLHAIKRRLNCQFGIRLVARFNTRQPVTFLREYFRVWQLNTALIRSQENLREQYQRYRSKQLTGVFARISAGNDRMKVVKAYSSWRNQMQQRQMHDLSILNEKRKIHISKLEARVRVLRDEIAENSSISTKFEQEIQHLRQRLQSMNYNMRLEDTYKQDRLRQSGIRFLMQIFQSRERKSLSQAWSRWNTYISRQRNEQLSLQFQEKQHESRKAVQRIPSLVRRAHDEHMATERLLNSI